MIDPIKMIVVNSIGSILLALSILFYKYIYPKRTLNLFVLLLLISLLPLISIFRTGTYESGDLTLHTVFLQSFFENIQDGILLPRWTGGLCAGYGCPTFLFEYIMPFYMGTFFHLLGFSYLDSMKLFLASSFILSGITMYLFLRDEFKPSPAFVGALLYLFAPIHLMEMHFRVSVGTHAAFIFIPLAFLFAKKALEGKPLYIVLGAINFLCIILSHSSIAFVIVPGSLLYAFVKKNNLRQLLYPVISIVLGAGLTAFYILPALFELKYHMVSVTISTISDFKPFFEYIFSPVRYGLLFQGNHGEVRLIVGYAQLFIVLYALYGMWKNKFDKKQKTSIIFLLIFFFTCFLLMLSFTKPLWNSIFFLRSFVLPWRMLVPLAFITACLGAYTVTKWKNPALILFCLFIIGSTILNWGNRKMVPFDPNEYYRHWSLYTEYIEPNNPLYVKRMAERGKNIPELVLHRPTAPLEILEGKGEIKPLKRTQIYHEYLVSAKTDVELAENTYYFPGWKVYVNGKEVTVDITNPKKFGTLAFALPPGLYRIEAVFQNTKIRDIGKYISLATGTLLLFLLLKDNSLRNNILYKGKTLKKNNYSRRNKKNNHR